MTSTAEAALSTSVSGTAGPLFNIEYVYEPSGASWGTSSGGGSGANGFAMPNGSAAAAKGFAAGVPNGFAPPPNGFAAGAAAAAAGAPNGFAAGAPNGFAAATAGAAAGGGAEGAAA